MGFDSDLESFATAKKIGRMVTGIAQGKPASEEGKIALLNEVVPVDKVELANLSEIKKIGKMVASGQVSDQGMVPLLKEVVGIKGRSYFDHAPELGKEFQACVEGVKALKIESNLATQTCRAAFAPGR